MIVEVRTYRMQPGARDGFLDFFRREAQPRMEAVGMNLVGAFASLTDPDVLVYIRTFASVEQREEQYRAFYRSEDWLGWMIDEALGKEESFDTFLGTDDVGAVPLGQLPSGIHGARVAAAGWIGRVTAIGDGLLTIGTDDGETMTLRLTPSVLVTRTPTGSGLQPAVDAALGDLELGCRVLVVADSCTGEQPVALQIVRRD
jgi:hypothetical protein